MWHKNSLKRLGYGWVAVIALFLFLAHPLWAAENSASTKAQEESVYQGFKRKWGEWFGTNDKSEKTKKVPTKKTEKKSEGGKAVNKVKERMKKSSDNVSKSVDKDKKTIEKKLNKWFGEKK